MNAFWEETVSPDRTLTDPSGCWAPPEVLRLFQEAAARHAAGWGYSDDALGRDHRAWIVVRQGLRFASAPPDGAAPLRLCTWTGQARHGLYPRYYELRRGEDTLISGWAMWAVLDLERRALLSPAESGVTLPDTVTGREEPLRRLRPAALPHRFSFSVSSDRIDRNGHMNNVRYVEAALLPRGAAGLTALTVEYRAEALAGDELEITWGGSGGDCAVQGTVAGRLSFLAELHYA